MSDTTTTKPLDEAQVEKFKQRFAAGRAKQIEDANTLAVAKDGEATQIEAELVGLRTTSELAKKQWQDKRNLRESKAKPPPETTPEAQLRVTSEKADGAVTAAEKRLADTQQERDEALKLTVKLPREGYNEQGQAIVGRLKGSGKKIEEVDPTLIAAMKALLDRRDYDGAGARLAEGENKVRAVVAGRDLPPLHARLRSRLATLAKQVVTEAKVLKELTQQLDGVDPATPSGPALATLEATIAPAVQAAEDRVGGFLALHAKLASEIVDQKRRAGKVDALELELGKCLNLAKQDLPKAAKRLADLQIEVDKADLALAEIAQAKLDYPVLLADVEAEIVEFPTRTPSHVSYNLGGAKQLVVQAKGFAAKSDWPMAMIRLNDAEDKLQDWDTNAWKSDKSQSDAAKLKQQQAAAALKAKKLAAAKLQAQLMAESAASTTSLDAIGRNTQFLKWFARVKALLDQGLVALDYSDPYWLAGDTVVEVQADVAGVGGEADFLTDFVVHWHPDASTKNPYGSPIHAKPYPGNAKTIHADMPSGHWLFGTKVPSLTGIRDWAKTH